VEISHGDFVRLAEFMKTHYGINLTKKKALIEGRLGLTIQKMGFSSFNEFVNYALNDPTGEAISLLTTKLTTNYTYFMREENHYYLLENNVLPELEKKIADRDLRIWSAGCSTGEEAYTIAMTIDHYFQGRKAGWDTRVLATDISPAVLKKAIAGIYDYNSLGRLPGEWIEKYFEKIDAHTYRIKDFIKNEVIFRNFNLMNPEYPFKKKMHVIFCRNVMIYFEKSTKQQIVNKFYNLLEDGGYLFIGHSESLGGMDTPFRYVVPSIYKKELTYDKDSEN